VIGGPLLHFGCVSTHAAAAASVVVNPSVVVDTHGLRGIAEFFWPSTDRRRIPAEIPGLAPLKFCASTSSPEKIRIFVSGVARGIDDNGHQLLTEDVSADSAHGISAVRPYSAVSLSVRPLIWPSLVQQRFQSTATPGASGKERVNQIVEEISRLTLLETADLISQLKVFILNNLRTDLKAKLKIADMAMPVAAAPAAAPLASKAAQDEPAQDAAPAPAEKPILTIKLESPHIQSHPRNPDNSLPHPPR
jgi:ribosomal protein L7/L12